MAFLSIEEQSLIQRSKCWVVFFLTKQPLDLSPSLMPQRRVAVMVNFFITRSNKRSSMACQATVAEKTNRSNDLLNLKLLEFENETGQQRKRKKKQHKSESIRSVCVGIIPKIKTSQSLKVVHFTTPLPRFGPQRHYEP